MANYKIGDRVRVKSWEDLLKMGHLSDGDIIPTDTNDTDWQFLFASTMHPLCGQTYFITNVDYDGGYSVEGSNYFLEDWMLEEESPPALCVEDITGTLGEWMGKLEDLPEPVAVALTECYNMAVSFL